MTVPERVGMLRPFFNIRRTKEGRVAKPGLLKKLTVKGSWKAT